MINREILFKGIDLEGEWVEGYYGIKGKGTDLEKHFIMKSTLSNSSIPSFYFTDVEIIPETASQYTGLKDKEGNMIFEGDIMQYQFEDEDNKPFITEFNRGAFCYYYDSWEDYIRPRLENFQIEKAIVIGNIHDNKAESRKA